jgi:hypothetical protein
MNSQKVKNRSFMSFPQRRESSLYKGFWTPAFAGVTAWGTFYEAIKPEPLWVSSVSVIRTFEF